MAETLINLAIATRERQAGLAALLSRLSEIDPPQAHVEIVVVDNDPDGSAEAVVTQACATSRWPITYLHEPSIGIAFARNRALDHCQDGTLLAFIDDDEIPDVRWLAELEAGLHTYEADIVTGPVHREFPPGTPDWIRRSRSPDEVINRPTGDVRHAARTGNFLARVDAIRERHLRFDERLPLLGGTDSELSGQLVRGGGRIVWIAEAIVTEQVPEARVGVRWMLQRPFRKGFASASRHRLREPGKQATRVELRRAGKEYVRSGRRLVRGSRFGSDRLYHAAYSFAKATGIVAALSPVRIGFSDYRTVDPAGIAPASAIGSSPPDPGSGPLKVLHVYPRLNRYGVCRQLVGYIKHSTDPSAHHLALLLRQPDIDADLPNPPVRIRATRFWRGTFPRKVGTTMALRRFIKDLRPDVVHAYNARASIYAGFGVPRRTPLVVSRHGAVPEKMRAWFPWVERVCYRNVRTVIALSEEVARTLPQRTSYPPIRIVPNGVDLERFQRAPKPEPGDPTVVMVARLNETKRHDLLLRAIAILAEGPVPDVRGVIVGDGPNRATLEALSHDLGITDHIRFAGEVEDVRPFVAEARVAALISQHEGFGNVLLEAMAMGRPVVASRRGAIPEVVRDGIDGMLTDLDPQDIADALAQLLTDPERSDAMGVQASERAETFGWTAKVGRLEQVYRDAAGRS
jgi:glycosyltransferase involved in cell wall biosynthesis